MEKEITFPSGLVGVLRSLKVKDERLLADTKLQKRHELIQTLLEQCWVRTTDPGPYKISGDTISWPSVLDGDAFFGLVQLRILTYGDDYEFGFMCPTCKRSSTQVQRLSELTLKTLPEGSKRKFTAGEPFVTTLAGKQVQFRLLTLRDEKAVYSLQEPPRSLTPRLASLVQRIVAIEGLGPGVGNIIKFIDELEAGEAADLEEIAESFDCGLESMVDVVCGNCYASRKVVLPLEPRFLAKDRKPSDSQEASIGS